ncbi:hypothetical protein H0H92_007763, partial [Tricholoma furcatifolium]
MCKSVSAEAASREPPPSQPTLPATLCNFSTSHVHFPVILLPVPSVLWPLRIC